MEKINLLCVYDTMRKGYTRNHLVRSCNYVGEFISEPNYDLYFDSNNNTVRLIKGESCINFEVYEVTDDVLKTLNFIYSSTKDLPVRLCNLNVIETPFGDALTYYNNVKISNPINILTPHQIKSFFLKNEIIKNETTEI